MDILTRGVMLAALAAGCTILAPTARGQDTARVVRDNRDGTFLVQIGRDTLLAISKARADATQREKARLQRDVAERDTLISVYRLGRGLADSALVHCRDYALQADSLYRGYRALADGYRGLSRDAWLTFDAGLGASGPDRSPAVLLGLGFRRIRLWGFFQERNAGGFLGASLRLF